MVPEPFAAGTTTRANVRTCARGNGRPSVLTTRPRMMPVFRAGSAGGLAAIGEDTIIMACPIDCPPRATISVPDFSSPGCRRRSSASACVLAAG